MPPTLIYDGDCAFCERCSQVVRRRLPGVAVIAWQHAELAEIGLTPEAAAAAVQFVDTSGRTAAGHLAIAELLIQGGGAMRWAGRFLRLPGVRAIARRAYAFVAAHRHRLPGGTAACTLASQQADTAHTLHS